MRRSVGITMGGQKLSRWQSGWAQEVGDVDAQGRGQPLNIVERHVALAALNGPDIRAMQVSKFCQSFLRHAPIRTQRPEMACEPLPCGFLADASPWHDAGKRHVWMTLDLQT